MFAMTGRTIAQSASRRLSRRDLHKVSLAAGAAMATTSLAGRRSAAAAQATPAADSDLDARFAELDNFVAQRMTELNVPGVAVGVIAGDREHTATFGVTNIDHPLPVDEKTLFQVGSTTKTVTATALMRLVEQERLDLDGRVQTHLPEFRVGDPEVSANVRLRHLVTHTAGWLDGGVQETGDGDDALARFVAGMAGLPQIAPLGEYFSYNNAAVSLAGRVIEAVTGQTYEAAATEMVLRPLGMERAAFFPEEIMNEAFAVGHGFPPGDPEGNPVVLEPWGLPRSLNPAGGLVSSLEEQLRYARFHLGDGTVNGARVLSSESMRRMQEPLGPGGTVPAMTVPFDAVGVIWQLWQRDGQRIVSHPGGTAGQLSVFSLIPEQEFAWTLLTNAQSGLQLGFEVTDRVLEGFLGLSPEPLGAAPIAGAPLAEFIGEYANPDGSQTIRIRAADDTLHLELSVPGQPGLESEMRPVGEDLFVVTHLWVTALTDFVRDDTGKMAWVRFLGRLVPRVD
jgi:CubicO group peptidase (beta-lactamase class C family)